MKTYVQLHLPSVQCKVQDWNSKGGALYAYPSMIPYSILNTV